MVGWALQASKVGDLDEPDYLTVHPTPSRGKRLTGRHCLVGSGEAPRRTWIGWALVEQSLWHACTGFERA